MNRNGTGQRYTFHNVIWRAFQAAGLSRRDIALQAGLSAEVATGQMVTCRQFFAIWDAISSLSGDLGIGFRVGKMAGEPSDNPAVYALLPAPFASAIHAGNFVDAAQRIARIKSLCAPEDMFVEDLGDRVIFSLKPHCIEETGPEIPDSLVDASDFVRMVENRQGIQIAALEEIAYQKQWIDRETLLSSAEKYGKSPYGQHLRSVAEGKILY